MGYSYYDTPEGEDCFKKMWFMTKYGAFAGAAFAVHDVMLYSHPQGFAQTLVRFGSITLPVTAMAASYAATACAAAAIRKKDDYVNPFLGAVSSAAIFGAWQKSLHRSLLAAVFFSGAALLNHHARVEGYQLLPDAPREYGGVEPPKKNWSWLKE